MVAVNEVSNIITFDGGLNLTDPPYEIKDNELTVCENMWYNGETLCKRPGFFKAFSASRPSAPIRIIGRNELTGEYLLTEGSNLWRATMGSAINAVTGLPAANTPTWVLYVNGIVYVGFTATGQIRPLAAGVIGAAIANSPAGSTTAVWHKSRIFTNVVGTPGRIAFSDPNAAGTWQVASTIDIGVDDLENISALVSLGDLLLIFKKSSVYTLYVQGDTPGNWVARKINNTLGCAPTIAGSNPTYSYNGEVYFIASTGVFKTNGSSFINLSRNIWIPEDPKYGISANGSWRITKWNDTLIICGGNVVGGYTYTYNLVNKAWSSWTFLGNAAGLDDIFVATTETFNLVVATRGTEIYMAENDFIYNYNTLLAAGANSFADGFLYNTVGSGSAYTATIKSKRFTAAPDKLTRVKWVGLEYLAYASPLFYYMADDVQLGTPLGVSPGFNSTNRKGYKIPGIGRCRSFALFGIHSDKSPWEFNRVDFHTTGKIPLITSGAP